MTISKGEPWGHPGPAPDGLVSVDDDAQASAALQDVHLSTLPALHLSGGDLYRTLGGSGPAAMTFPIDLVEACVDGRRVCFVAHLVMRSRLWGRSLVVMNVPWLGSWNLAPRAHPNDGLLDVFNCRLTPRQRLQVRSRLPLGTHLPHPGIRHSRVPEFEYEFQRSMQVWVDGRVIGRARRISVRVLADAANVVV